jgi:hypothetical protein
VPLRLALRFVLLALREEDHAEVVVGDREVCTDEEVGGDQAGRPGELPFAAVDTPHHRAVFAQRIGAAIEVAAADAGKTELVAITKGDRSRLDEARLAGEGDVRREGCLAAGGWLELTGESIWADDRDQG